MSMNVWLSPKGKPHPITGGNSYRAALSIFDLLDLYEDKARASIESNEPIGFEKYLFNIGYSLFTNSGVLIPDSGLTAAQVIFVRAYASSLNATQRNALAERGYVLENLEHSNSIGYYRDILKDIETQFEQGILDTYGNTHDFNRDRSNITYAMGKLKGAAVKEESEERSREIQGLILRIRQRLVDLYTFAEGEMKEVRLRERIILMNHWEKEGKLYAYLQGKRDNIKRMLGMEVEV